MKRYGLIGYPLGHSFSKKYFGEKFARENITGCTYENFPIEDISLLPGLLAGDPAIRGINVTIPYKELVIPYLDSLSEEASRVGAVNCIEISRGRLTGHNTDVFGFRSALLDFIGAQRPDAVILGTGGASKAVRYVLDELGLNTATVSRTKSENTITYPEITEQLLVSHPLIVNTTPLGTYPAADTCPDIPYDKLSGRNYLFDLVYNPEQTLFMKLGAERGARTTNGYAMLTGQAERAWDIWQGNE